MPTPTKSELQGTIESLQNRLTLTARELSRTATAARERASAYIAAGLIPVELLTAAQTIESVAGGGAHIQITTSDQRIIGAIEHAADREKKAREDFDRILHGDPLSGLFGGRA